MNRVRLLRDHFVAIVAIAVLGCATVFAQEKETLAPLALGEQAPKNFEEMWTGFDPRAEPLEIETLKEWEEDGVVLRVIRFRIGVFKGKTARLAAIYGYPKLAASRGEKLPGLLQIHGGGQYADYRACLANARRGYATISIAWAGRINAPGYLVNPKIVKLFWDGKTDIPAYKLTTDWGSLDAYHAPSRNPKNNFTDVRPESWTLDAIDSPRNSPWFLCALAARRALTFLEKQPEVDADRLGVYGHSMGGKLTVMTAVDPRVKAAAPSCGGISDRDNESELFRAAVGDDVSLNHISCPIVFQSPANDFHGRIGDLPRATKEIASKQWRVTCSPHLNHQDYAEYEVASLLWFDQHLKGQFEFPETPQTKMQLDTTDGVPVFFVKPDPAKPFSAVDIYYTQHGKSPETRFDRDITMNRFWRHATAVQEKGLLSAKLSIVDPEKPLWVYANVTYPLKTPVSGAGYYYRAFTANSYNLSSLLVKITPDQLKAASVESTIEPTSMIESFSGDWTKEWFTYKPNEWPRSTHKIYDDSMRASDDAKLTLQIRSKEKNTLVVQMDEHAATIEVAGGEEWQSVQIARGDLKDYGGQPLSKWQGIKTLKLSYAVHLKPKRGGKGKPRKVGKNWIGPPPEFRDLQWEDVEETAVPKSSKLPSFNSPIVDTLKIDASKILDVFPESVVNFSNNRFSD